MLYVRLKERKKTALFPAKYLGQVYFAESDVFGAGVDEEEEEGKTEKVEFLSKRNAAFKGKNYTWYLYKVSFTDEDGSQSYLGIAGGYTVAGTDLKPKMDWTGIYWKDQFDADDISSLFNAYLQTLIDQ
jgi:hypothetical protein